MIPSIIAIIFLIIICVLAILYYKKLDEKVYLYYFIGSIIPGIIIPVMLYSTYFRFANYSKEYWCAYAATVSMHEGYWTTYTTTDSKGNTTTHTYYTPPSYALIDMYGSVANISESEYVQVGILWGYKPHSNSDFGFTYNYNWTGNQNGKIAMTTEHSYLNKTQNDGSLYKYDELDKEDIVSYKLFNRNIFINNYQINYTYGKIPIKFNSRVSDFNARYGHDHQIIVNFLVFDSNDINSAIKQEIYWKGGAKNELNVCYGVDQNNNILWSKVFSWSNSEKLKADIQNLQTIGDPLNLDKTLAYIEQNINRWERRQFSEFNYIQTHYPFGFIITIIIVDGLYIIGFLIYVYVAEKGTFNQFNYQTRLRSFKIR